MASAPSSSYEHNTTPTLILVMSAGTAKKVAKAFDATLVPASPKMKDLARLTHDLAAGKTVVGFLVTLAVGWVAPPNTVVVIHPECYAVRTEEQATLIVQAKARPKPTPHLLGNPNVAPIPEDLSKKKRIALLEERLRLLLQAVSPFVAFGKGLGWHGKTLFGSKVIYALVSYATGDQHQLHLGEVKWRTESATLMQLSHTRKEYTPGKKGYEAIPSGDPTEVTVGDFVALSDLVSAMLTTQMEDASGIPVQTSEATASQGESGLREQGAQAPA